MSTGYANTNALHAAVAAETLAHLGVRAAIISPGSRSTPLTHALATHGALACTPVLDERTAGFVALGHAKATGMPAVLLCTSGTAAANYLPAVIEARMSGTPLIVLTADRPHEMRDCASGQTIDQVKIFGGQPVWQAELSAPAVDYRLTLKHWRSAFAHAVERAVALAGPAHLNLPFRDPLAPHETQPGFEPPADFDLKTFCARKKPVAVVPGDNTVVDIAFWTKCNAPKDVHHRGIIVVGSGPGDARRAEPFARGVLTLARFLGYPVLCDSLNALRTHPDADESVITGYDLILRDPESAARLRPSVVVRIGQLPTSKTLRRRLEEWDAPTLVVSPSGDDLDPLHGRAATLHSAPERWATDGFARKTPVEGYAEHWSDLDASVELDLASALAAEGELVEPHVTEALARHLPEGTPLFVANSMPVRDTETFLRRGARVYPVLHNRGANGIDGTLGTAVGVTAGFARPCALITGDLSLLHDTNALLVADRLATTLTVILVNNAGGGIFNHLAIAADPAFEEFWGTPQPVDFARLASAYRAVSHTHITDRAALAAALAEVPVAPGIRILEVTTNRARDAAWRKKQFARIGGA